MRGGSISTQNDGSVVAEMWRVQESHSRRDIHVAALAPSAAADARDYTRGRRGCGVAGRSGRYLTARSGRLCRSCDLSTFQKTMALVSLSRPTPIGTRGMCSCEANRKPYVRSSQTRLIRTDGRRTHQVDTHAREVLAAARASPTDAQWNRWRRVSARAVARAAERQAPADLWNVCSQTIRTSCGAVGKPVVSVVSGSVLCPEGSALSRTCIRTGEMYPWNISERTERTGPCCQVA